MECAHCMNDMGCAHTGRAFAQCSCSAMHACINGIYSAVDLLRCLLRCPTPLAVVQPTGLVVNRHLYLGTFWAHVEVNAACMVIYVHAFMHAFVTP
eukprot:366175-Chlamydomonas_euryale.AAC.7